MLRGLTYFSAILLVALPAVAGEPPTNTAQPTPVPTPTPTTSESVKQDIDEDEDLNEELPVLPEEEEKANGVTASPTPLPSTPTPSPVPSANGQVNYNPRIPLYQQLRPKWAIALVGSGKGLGGVEGIPNAGGAKIRGLSLQFEYQPAFIQSYGVLSFGTALSSYPTFPNLSYFGNRFPFWSVGGQIRYQARYFREQPIVPYVGYEAERLFYKLSSGGPSGNFTLNGPVVGGMLLLNIVDSGGAAAFYANYRVCRSYLVAELRSLTGGDGTVNLDENSLFFGLRFEL